MNKILKHSASALLEGGLIAVIAVTLIAGSALAGKPARGGTSGSFRVDGGVFAGTSAVQAGGASWWAHARCSQAGTVVYEQWVKTDESGRGAFTNGPSPMWTGGAASCWAENGTWSNSRFRSAGTTTFNVSG